jgi:hypothetical protein
VGGDTVNDGDSWLFAVVFRFCPEFEKNQQVGLRSD